MNESMYEAFERLEETHWWFEGRRRIFRSVLQRHLPPQQLRSILDVGSGTGGMFPLLSEFGAVQGAEFSPDARERSHRRFPQFQVSPCELPQGLPEGTFQLITCFDVLEHLDEPVDSLREMKRRLAPQGQLVITVPALQFLWSQHDEVTQHRRRYSKRLFKRQLEDAGFVLDELTFFNSALLVPIAAVRLLERFSKKRLATESDLKSVPAALNAILKALFGAERHVMATVPLPLGVSLLAVCHVS
jgi:SAM-dependent methyltransferase